MKGRIFILGLICLTVILGCRGRGETRQTEQASDNRECIQNFTYQGSFMSGRTFKTHQLVRNVSKSDAVERAARHIAKSGWHIKTIDKDIGVISAEQTVSFGKGKTAPLNVTVEPVQEGVKVSLSFSISGGESVRGGALQNGFCSIIEAIEK